MPGFTLSADEIEAAPAGVRRWLEQQVGCILARVEPAPHMTAPRLPENAVKADGDVGDRSSGVDRGSATQCMVKAGTPEGTSTAEAIRKLIAARAYELWESQGRPDGRDQANWRQAEHEIMSCTGGEEGPAASEERAQGDSQRGAEP